MKLKSELLFVFDQNECGTLGDSIRRELDGGLFTEHANVITVKCTTSAELARIMEIAVYRGGCEASINTQFRRALESAFVNRIG